MEREVVDKGLRIGMLFFIGPILNIKYEILDGLASDDPEDCEEITDITNNNDELQDAQGIGDQKNFFYLVIIKINIIRQLMVVI